ncbi:BolA family transcriptional regulator [Pseudanabaena sp. FACHB-1277]|jgi:BolA protein|uniref:BolA family transcriptional regulator n=1 Tax=Pseudanabaena cinerea FACHB-1277 TaxID=2949581 RepID=A0A926UU39_9CYAN|nr:BolA family protein [Pseudanabaena cinerea]MBD2150856.1 BolA family transcriptional regulator [Pseudanabaena cinerea FACHB-1277]
MDAINNIKAILQDKLGATIVEITDRSDQHKHHQGRKNAPEGSGHYDLIIVSECFADTTIMQQHRMVYNALSDQMQTTIHALSIKTYTPDLWTKTTASTLT